MIPHCATVGKEVSEIQLKGIGYLQPQFLSTEFAHLFGSEQVPGSVTKPHYTLPNLKTA